MSETDGRRQRRAANRESVLDALIQLFDEGQYQPSTSEIAARAGISPRSLFRYFDDFDDLVRAAIDHSIGAALPLVDHGIDPRTPTAEKIERFVAARIRLFDATAPAAGAARATAHRHQVVAQQIHDSRAFLRTQLRELFAPELDGTSGECFPALDALCSFETYVMLRRDQGMSARRAGRVLTSAMRLLLEVPADR